MDSLIPQLEDLTSNVDDLESALAPLLNTALSSSIAKLPLLDKAKFYVLATYAIEAIIFSYLRLHGVDAKTHAVFKELSRVKEYFGKIKTAEEIGAGGRSAGAGRLDKAAAGRFIKAGLAGNDRYDREREERREKERAGAKRKLDEITVGTHTRFGAMAKRSRAEEEERINVVKASELESQDEDAVPESLDQVEQAHTKKRQKREPLSGAKWDAAVKQMEQEDGTAGVPEPTGDSGAADGDETAGKKKKRKNKKGKRGGKMEKAGQEASED